MATRRRRTTTSRKPAARKRSGCLIWLIPAALGMILILANRDVRESLSRFISSLAGTNSAPRTTAPDRDPDLINTIISRDMQATEQKNLAAMQRQLDALEKRQQSRTPAPRTQGKPDKPADTGKGTDKSVTFKATIFFVRYDAARDKIHLVPVTRTISRTKTPALTVLGVLLGGPTAPEKQAGLATLIPPGTRIRRLHVVDGVLLVDLSNHFIRGQKFGMEGMILQLYQIVNSMIRFATVSGVRFLIDGKTVSSAGGDWIRMDRVFTAKTNPLE